MLGYGGAKVGFLREEGRGTRQEVVEFAPGGAVHPRPADTPPAGIIGWKVVALGDDSITDLAGGVVSFCGD